LTCMAWCVPIIYIYIYIGLGLGSGLGSGCERAAHLVVLQP
jgi:hypothetical protein